MTKRRFRAAAAPFALALLASPAFECGGARPAAAPVVAHCPDVADDAAVLAYDWTSFGLDAEHAGDVKRALATANEVKRLAASVDAHLKTGCGGLATDLGAPAHFASGKAACDAASRAVHDAFAKLGKATIALDASVPKCGAPLDVFTACAAQCDPKAAPACESGKLQGTCTGACSGACDVEGESKCNGTCSGKCDGKCKGKCNGVASRGVCAGTCEGVCTGACTGSCDLRASAPCSGTCTGACDVEMKSSRCVAEIASTHACAVRCNARADSQIACTRARVAVTIRARDKALAKKLRAALENDLPLVLQMSSGMRARLEELAAESKSLLESARATATGPLAACVSTSLTEGLAAAESIRSSVEASSSIPTHMP